MRTLILAASLLISCNSWADKANITLNEQQIKNLGIQLGRPVATQQVASLYAPAKVTVPTGQAFVVSASQPGLISQLNVNAGDTVKKGQVLAVLQSPELVSLQSQYLKSLSQQQLASASYRRDQKLLDDGIIPERRWQETQAEYSGRVSESNEARQLLELAGMSDADIKALAQTHKLSQQLAIRAPIDGVVLERMVGPGQRLDILAPLFHVGNLAQLWLEIDIPQEKIGNVKTGDKVLIDNSDISATISLLGQSVNPNTQTILGRAVINGQPSSLKVGQMVNIQISQAKQQTAFKVPNTAIAQSEGQSYLFIRNDEGFHVQPIQVLGRQENESMVSEGLTGNEQIAIKGAAALKANWLGLGGGEE